MRVIGGRLRGRVLATPADLRTRPTSDRVRESLFNILTHGVHAINLIDARVIDLFAGTGALGIEALSRGAAFALFVEDDPAARALIWTNIDSFGLTGVTKIFRRDATHLGLAGQMGQFDLALLDPPYGQGLGERSCRALMDGGWLSPGARVVIEERRDQVVALPEGLWLLDERVYGDTKIVLARFGS